MDHMPKTQTSTKYTYEELYRHGRTIIVIYYDEQVIGTLTFEPTDEHRAEYLKWKSWIQSISE